MVISEVEMKRTLTKDFHFTTYGGPDCYKAGMIVSGKRHKDGLLKEHFYCYGQNEIIPNEYFANPARVRSLRCDAARGGYGWPRITIFPLSAIWSRPLSTLPVLAFSLPRRDDIAMRRMTALFTA